MSPLKGQRGLTWLKETKTNTSRCYISTKPSLKGLTASHYVINCSYCHPNLKNSSALRRGPVFRMKPSTNGTSFIRTVWKQLKLNSVSDRSSETAADVGRNRLSFCDTVWVWSQHKWSAVAELSSPLFPSAEKLEYEMQCQYFKGDAVSPPAPTVSKPLSHSSDGCFFHYIQYKAEQWTWRLRGWSSTAASSSVSLSKSRG